MRKGFALLTIVCLAAPAHAETLAGALARTLATNPALEAARSNYKVSYKEQFVTMADMLPQIRGFASRVETDIDLENTRTNTDIDVPDVETDSYGVEVEQTYFRAART